MKYKLYYTNEYGQIVSPTGQLVEKSEANSDCYEVFENLDDAKIKGEAFLKNHPLMTCTIYFGNDNNEIILFPNEEDFKKAMSKKQQDQRLKWKKQNKFRFIYKCAWLLFLLVIFLLVSLIIA